jgi:hypothetical protein
VKWHGFPHERLPFNATQQTLTPVGFRASTQPTNLLDSAIALLTRGMSPVLLPPLKNPVAIAIATIS